MRACDLKPATSSGTYQGNNFADPHLGRRTVSVDYTKGHSAMDYAEHAKTYAGFVRFSKYAIITAALILIGMKIFLV